MHPGGQLSGEVNGDGGTDVLSYSLYTTPIQVDLAQGTATDLGGVTNVENVWGGSGDDILLGDEGANQLDGGIGNDALVGRGGEDNLAGGMGRDLLIGGLGSDTLHGGPGEDILIGGSTTHDDQVANINAIMSEWGRTDHSRKRRIWYLTNGGGFKGGGSNGSVVLNKSTIIDDAAVDQLFGEGDLDLFWAGIGDQSDAVVGEL
jgi:Ca2+-binding RTX toxin-like protein